MIEDNNGSSSNETEFLEEINEGVLIFGCA